MQCQTAVAHRTAESCLGLPWPAPRRCFYSFRGIDVSTDAALRSADPGQGWQLLRDETYCGGVNDIINLCDSGGNGSFDNVRGIETVLHDFGGVNDGIGPARCADPGSDGNFYGITIYGGTGELNSGVVFKITPAGSETVIYAFGFRDGYFPSGLIQGSDGNFYGTTVYGGANDAGTIFVGVRQGVETVLYPSAASIVCQGRGWCGPDRMISQRRKPLRNHDDWRRV